MKLPFSLLKSFLPLDLPLAQIAEALTLLGIEVDAIEQEHPPFNGVVVGEVLSASRHPNAEKLQIAEVYDGEKTHQVVCGASNCRAGLKTAFARVGARLYDAKGQSFSIKVAKLRGVESFGMLCSASELLMEEDSPGILELDASFQPGQDLLPLLWDSVFNLSLTPNLGYCLSAKGIARELSAFLNIALHAPPAYPLVSQGDQIVKVSVKNSDLCPRYLGQAIEGVKIGPSPFWLQQVLKKAGMRPINNAVDITNYILLKWGQPMHVFDLDLLEGDLSVCTAMKELSFSCLDGVLRTIVPGTLIISDEKEPVALAGIMGGESSSVSEKTKKIFLEAAFFDPEIVRKASKILNLRSESSLRFEKGIDPDSMFLAFDEARHLLLSLCGGCLCGDPINTNPQKTFPPKKIHCRAKKTAQMLGTPLSLHEIEEIFTRLQFKVQVLDQDVLEVFVPPYRFDILEEIDLIEEVARIYGYNSIEKKAPLYSTSSLSSSPLFVFENKLKKSLMALELQEILTCDLISPKLAELAIETKLPHIEYLKVLHAKSEEYSILRPSLLPGFLQVVQYNLDQKNKSMSGFELGHIYFKDNEQHKEIPMLGIFLTGKTSSPHWDQKARDVDFYDLKGILENLFESLHICSISYKTSSHPSFHPGVQASLYKEEQLIGSLGEVHPKLLDSLDIKAKVFYAEIHVDSLLALQPQKILMQEIALFPSSERDWTIPLPKGISLQPLFDAIESFESPLLEKAEFIDLFVADTQNATFRFTYRDPLKTISFEEVEKEHAKMMQFVLASLQSILLV